MGANTRSFDDPDEVIEMEKLSSEVITLGGMSFSLDTHRPGWRWSEHVGPVVGTEWCESHHVSYVLQGRARIVLRDGTEFDCRAGDVVDIPEGHDGWVVGDEPFVLLSWVGGTTWLTPLSILKERILVTILFTDIVDSTGLAQKLGDRRWAALIANHDQRMTDVVDRYRGKLIKSTGDGVLAVFDGAARAIRCALAARSDAESLGLTIRAALHTGEVELAGADVHGLAVHEASRMLEAAQPDEILVSEVTKTFAGGTEVQFGPRRELELRGLEGSVGVHPVVAAPGSVTVTSS